MNGPLITAPGPFCGGLWASSQPVFDAIMVHPFLTGLTDGSLSRSAFHYFVVQDALYLRGFARALSLVSAHAEDAPDIALFATHAAGAISVERELHAELLGELGVDPELAESAAMMPTTKAYVDHLLAATALGSYGDGLAAVLPCYWIYAEVGQRLVTAGSPDAQYGKWISTYGGEEFAEVVQAVLRAAERVGDGLGAADRGRAQSRYSASARYEWMFWDAAHRQSRWPAFA